MTEKDVISYLQEHPDFFAHNPHALFDIEAPMASQGKNIADFQHFMTERLREDRNLLESQLGEVVGISRNNMQNQTRIHAAVIALLDAVDLEAFIEVICNELPLILDIDMAIILFEMADGDNGIGKIGNLEVSSLAEGTIDSEIGFGKMLLLEGGISANLDIFSESAALIKSQALLRLVVSDKNPDILLAFGSSQENGFNKDQGTELISFLARVIERQLRRWLA